MIILKVCPTILVIEDYINLAVGVHLKIRNWILLVIFKIKNGKVLLFSPALGSKGFLLSI
jgi:hypothetical protein